MKPAFECREMWNITSIIKATGSSIKQASQQASKQQSTKNSYMKLTIIITTYHKKLRPRHQKAGWEGS